MWDLFVQIMFITYLFTLHKHELNSIVILWQFLFKKFEYGKGIMHEPAIPMSNLCYQSRRRNILFFSDCYLSDCDSVTVTLCVYLFVCHTYFCSITLKTFKIFSQNFVF